MVSSEICSHLVFGVGVINFRADLSKVLAHASRARALTQQNQNIYICKLRYCPTRNVVRIERWSEQRSELRHASHSILRLLLCISTIDKPYRITHIYIFQITARIEVSKIKLIHRHFCGIGILRLFEILRVSYGFCPSLSLSLIWLFGILHSPRIYCIFEFYFIFFPSIFSHIRKTY